GWWRNSTLRRPPTGGRSWNPRTTPPHCQRQRTPLGKRLPPPRRRGGRRPSLLPPAPLNPSRQLTPRPASTPSLTAERTPTTPPHPLPQPSKPHPCRIHPPTTSRPHTTSYPKPSTSRSSPTSCSPPTTRPAPLVTRTKTARTTRPTATRPAPPCCRPSHPGCPTVPGGGPVGGNPSRSHAGSRPPS